MTYRVRILADAETDLEEIADYVAAHDSEAKARHLLDRLEEKCNSLSSHANRGHLPPDLRKVGVSEYREIHFKPYRIIYRVIKRDVYVYAILDGRRDLRDLLQKRLLRPNTGY